MPGLYVDDPVTVWASVFQSSAPRPARLSTASVAQMRVSLFMIFFFFLLLIFVIFPCYFEKARRLQRTEPHGN